METNCIYCGEPLGRGRSDRKFCDSTCRSRFHNAQMYHASSTKTSIIRRLERNYSILSDVIETRGGQASLGDLVDEGFNPRYVTSYIKNKGGDEVRCFDIKYRQSGMKVFNIRKKD